MREDATGVAREQREELELLGREVDLLLRDQDLVLREVHAEVAHFEDRVLGDRGGIVVTQCDAYAREQLGHRERLGDVVVGAFVEGHDLPIVGPLDREHDDRDARPLADPAAHLHPVEVGEVEVEDDHRQRLGRGDAQCLASRRGGHRLVAASLERGAQRPHDRRLVVNDENGADLSHGAPAG